MLLVKGKEHAKTKLWNQFVTEGVNQIEEGQRSQAESGAAETNRGSLIDLLMVFKNISVFIIPCQARF